jgi:integrase/recombinase XerD
LLIHLPFVGANVLSMIATCKLVLYHYQHGKLDPKKKYPVRLRISFKRVSRYFSLRISVTLGEFNKILTSSSLKEEFNQVSHFLRKAESITNELKEHFTWEEFEARFFVKEEPKPIVVDLLDSLKEYAESVKSEGRYRTYQSYITTYNRVKAYHRKKILPITSVTKEWLNAFANSLKNDGLKVASIGIYSRNLRCVFNWEISRGRIKPEIYPFGRNKFKPPSSTRVKKALTYEDVVKIFEYTPETESEYWARDMWLFSYLANGMNVKDIALLRYENITDNELSFVREKTKRKMIENQKLVHVFLHPQMLDIINRWGNKDKRPNQFIFDILNVKDLSMMQEYRDVNQAVKIINKYMKRIGRKLQLSKLPTCNFARHTYSTVLKRANVPIEVISEALGHTSVKTTEIYLDSFESETRAEISKLLLPTASS